MLSNKKYYIISEVADILNLPLYKLRYLEKSKQRLKVHKVNKRRYYTQDDIDFLKKYYKLSSDDTIVNSDESAYKERGENTTDCTRMMNDDICVFKSIDYISDVSIMSEDLSNTNSNIEQNCFLNKIDDLITKLNLVKIQLSYYNN